MPGFPTGVTPWSYTIAGGDFLAAGGDKASISIEHDEDQTVTEAQQTTWINAGARLSNAALDKRTFTKSEIIPLANVQPFDESYSSASVKLVMVFTNGKNVSRQFAIPAPDEQYFSPDGVTVDTTKQEVIEFNAATLAILNADRTGIDQFVFARGFRSDRARSLPAGRTVKRTAEPGLLDVPSGS